MISKYRGVKLPTNAELAKHLGVANITINVLSSKQKEQVLLMKLGIIKKREIDNEKMSDSMSYKILLQRLKNYDSVGVAGKNPEPSMIGNLKIIDTKNDDVLFECVTLENGGKASDERGRDKRIIARNYLLFYTFTTKSIGNRGAGGFMGEGISQQDAKDMFDKYSKLMDEKEAQRWFSGARNLCLCLDTKEIKDFKNRRILIHNGNYPQDTEGCILLGMGDNKNGTISESSKAVEKFYNIITKLNINDVILEIHEAIN